MLPWYHYQLTKIKTKAWPNIYGLKGQNKLENKSNMLSFYLCHLIMMSWRHWNVVLNFFRLSLFLKRAEGLKLYFCFLCPPSLIPSLLEHHTARLLHNGRLVTRGAYDLPSGDQNFKQGAWTVQSIECQASSLGWCLGRGQGLFSAVCSGELLIFIPYNNYSWNPCIRTYNSRTC